MNSYNWGGIELDNLFSLQQGLDFPIAKIIASS